MIEDNFKKVHTLKDLTISTIVFFAGVGLFFLNRGLGICIGICGLFMYLFYKGGYRKDGLGVLLTKKSVDICKGCRNSMIEFLEGKIDAPEIKKGTDGGCVRLEVYFDESKNVAYAQLYDFCSYDYVPATGIVQLDGSRAKTLWHCIF